MRGDETITVIPAAGRDEYGDPLPAGPAVTIRGCVVLPRRVNSPERGMVLIDGFEVFAVDPAEMEKALQVTARDTIRCRGDDYQVEGTPGDYRKSGRTKAVQMILKRAGT